MSIHELRSAERKNRIEHLNETIKRRDATIAELEAKVAALKRHADAMAEGLDCYQCGGVTADQWKRADKAAADYRKEFPK